MSRVEIAAVLALLSGCSLGNRIDACDAPVEIDRTVNALTAGDQFTNAGRSLAALPGGKLIAVWVSESGGEGRPSEVRAALLDSDGSTIAPCGMVTGDVAISQATDATVSRPSVAVGSSASSPIFITWRSQQIGDNRGTVLVRLMKQDLCAWNRGSTAPDLLLVSAPGEDAAAPSIAVRTDGLEALIAWSNPVALDSRIRSRPVGIATDHAGRLEANGCDGADTPCTHISRSVIGASAMAATPDGYALAWPEPIENGDPGWQIRFLLLDSLAVPAKTFVSPRVLPDAVSVDLSLVADDSQLVLATGLQFSTGMATAGSKIAVDQFTLDGAPIGSAIDVSTTEGLKLTPAVHLLSDARIFVAWVALPSDGTREVRGRILSPEGTPLFTGLACDVTDFALSSGPQKRGLGVSLAGGKGGALAVLFSDEVQTGPDTLGLSVRFRRFNF